MSFGYAAYAQNNHDYIHKNTSLRPHISRSCDVDNKAVVTAGNITALTRTHWEKMFLSDNDVQLQKTIS